MATFIKTLKSVLRMTTKIINKAMLVVFLTLSSASLAHADEFCSIAQAALNKNSGLDALRHQLDASSEQIFQSQNINGPKLDLLANLSARTAQQGSGTIYKDGALSLSYSQTLYDSGQSAALTAQAHKNKDMLSKARSAAIQETIVEAAGLYLDYLKNLQLLALHNKNIKTNNEQLRNIEDKFAASEATQQELMLVNSRVRQAMSQMLQAKAQVSISKVKLLAISNISARGSDDHFLRSLRKNIPRNKNLAITAAQNNSIDIAQSNIAIDIAQLGIDVQTATLGPKVQATANVGFGRVGVNEGAAGQVGINFTMPLYSSGILESRVREAKAMLASARANRAYMLELSKQTAVASYEVSKTISQAIAVLPEAIANEEAAINSLEQSLASSFIPIAEILLVKNSLFELRQNLINLQFDQHRANLNLINVVGGLNTISALKKTGLCH